MNTAQNISHAIEAILLYRGEPVSQAELAKIIGVSAGDIENALPALKEKWQGGVALVDAAGELSLMTSSEVAPLIEKLRKEELEKDLGKASLETLTIILYKGPISRREIDFIRGVQSQYILRALVSRGLVNRLERGNEGYVYEATHELMGLLGIREASELPEYGTLTAELNERLEGAIADAAPSVPAESGEASA